MAGAEQPLLPIFWQLVVQELPKPKYMSEQDVFTIHETKVAINPFLNSVKLLAFTASGGSVSQCLIMFCMKKYFLLF